MSLLQRITPGRIAYQLYYRPKAALRAASRRGLVNAIVDSRLHGRMKVAARALPCLFETHLENHEVHFLTGRRYWHQTAFCAWSLSKFGQVNITPVLHDDGTLTEGIVRPLRDLFPTLKVIPHTVAEELLDRHLPRVTFPELRSRRDVYPHLRKLTDVHVGSQGWKLVLDSDMLFFGQPVELLRWLHAPDRPCHLVDVDTSYGYPLDFLSRQCGHTVPEKVNVGITGLYSDSIPWLKLEQWISEQNARYGPHYYQEQALVAQLVAGAAANVLDANAYRVLPSQQEVESPSAVLHHYVADAKPWYYRYGWQNAIRSPARKLSPLPDTANRSPV